jgi:hypothetical protein
LLSYRTTHYLHFGSLFSFPLTRDAVSLPGRFWC